MVAACADGTRKLGAHAGRLAPFFNPLMLAPDPQDAVRHVEAVDGAEPMAKRTLRAVGHAGV